MFRLPAPRVQIIAALLFAATISGLAIAADDDAIATVNGVAVPKTRFELLLTSQTSQGEQDTPAFREELREIMITREVLAQEAQRRKLDDTDEFKAQIDAMRQQLLITSLFNQIIKELEPTEEAKRAEYERVKAETAKLGDKEYRVRHILVDQQADATAIIAELESGADFAAIAKEKSKDTGTREAGGELDWAEPRGYVKPFADAMVALKKGERTGKPVKTDFGYHVIELLDVRDVPFPAYEDVQEQVRKEILTRSRDDLIVRLREAAKIEKIGKLESE